ncbi:CPBP family intramembrane glutamic endopeptidase [Emticicia fluvialis]|uniref:CPBP family intramembrane glutamic endopeptidase n=1 Tax=Emticicia fluvialis TaxID=2974474 RepID=UPI0021658F08|nr:CPBP family intramembrane glutamic endopeptidase [Emticicia fluvialis]
MKNYIQHIRSGFIITGILFALFLYFNKDQPLNELLMASVCFVLLHLLLFTLGNEGVAAQLTTDLKAGTEKTLLFPNCLIALLYIYIIYHGGSPLEGSAALFPFFALFPVLGFLAFKKTYIVWSDFVFLLLLLIPSVSISFKSNTSLPVHGNGFSSVYKLVIMLLAFYAFGIVRGIKDIGFYPVFQWRALGIALVCWLGFLGLVWLIAYASGFLNLSGAEAFAEEGFAQGLRNMIRVFLGTALFEELFFRGLIQNMLAKKIGQYKNWRPFWQWSLVLFAALAFLTGYLMDKSLFWLPLLITGLLFVAAYLIEKSGKTSQGTYTALAITSIFFGLVHFHAGSIIFVGLASIAGWFYGYTYLKTRNVFYAALVHTLVNSSEFLFALDGLR